MSSFFIAQQNQRAGCLKLCMDRMMSCPLPMVQKETFVLQRAGLVNCLPCDFHKSTKISALHGWALVCSTLHSVTVLSVRTTFFWCSLVHLYLNRICCRLKHPSTHLFIFCAGSQGWNSQKQVLILLIGDEPEPVDQINKALHQWRSSQNVWTLNQNDQENYNSHHTSLLQQNSNPEVQFGLIRAVFSVLFLFWFLWSIRRRPKTRTAPYNKTFWILVSTGVKMSLKRSGSHSSRSQ